MVSSRYTVNDSARYRMARIGLNLLFLVPNQVGGTEYLTRNFINLLRNDSANTYILFCNQENAPTFTFSAKNISKVVCSVRASNRIIRLLYEQFILPFQVANANCTLLHSFGYTAPLFLTSSSIVTVHDANWIDHPEDFTFFSRMMTHFLVSLACLKSKTIITDSDFSKLRLSTHLPWAKKKIKVVSPFVPSEVCSPPFEQLPKKLDGTIFALCVSAHYPHKQIPYLLKMWNQVHALQPTAKLVLVGQHGKDHPSVLKLIADQESVIYYPKVSFPLLKSLYHFAHVFIHPSIYEGFGYPVYEAGANNCPVIVGKKSLYPSRVASRFLELTFDENQDAKQIIPYLQLPRKSINIPLPAANDSLKTLLQVYEK
ncbi:glycosyltransferase family 4 protein [Candidatus Woesebacteria bacterium]|nr:glycosyltransferase family 4 protein [Candidatus Woesebacteria bacterium]